MTADETSTNGTSGMTLHRMAGLHVGDVLTSISILETYPTYWIEEGARFVVVVNDLARKQGGSLSMRLVPADKHLLKSGDLSEWGDAVVVYDPVTEGVEHAEGVDPEDMAAPGNAWSSTTVGVKATPDALTLGERVAAVFANELLDDIGSEMMGEVMALNAVETDPTLCHSHDFCDANMDMLAAFKAMGLKTPLDALEDKALGEGPSVLWNEAWSIARNGWFIASASAEVEPHSGPAGP